MDQTNNPLGSQNQPLNTQNPLGGVASPITPLGPGMPSPLNTAAQTAAGMTSSTPSDPLGRSAGEGLPVQSSSSGSGSGGSKKILLLIIAVLILAVAGIGTYYFYTVGKVTEEPKEEEVQIQPVDDLKILGDKLEEVEITDPEADFIEVNQEIDLLGATASAAPDEQ